MDELIGQLADKAGIDGAVAEKTVGIILSFLRSEGPSDKVQALIDTIPGAEATIAASNEGGGLIRLMGGGLMAVCRPSSVITVVYASAWPRRASSARTSATVPVVTSHSAFMTRSSAAVRSGERAMARTVP